MVLPCSRPEFPQRAANCSMACPVLCDRGLSPQESRSPSAASSSRSTTAFATGAGQDLDAFLRIARGLRETFVVQKVPAIMFINERQLEVDGHREERIAIVKQWLDAGWISATTPTHISTSTKFRSRNSAPIRGVPSISELPFCRIVAL